MPRKKKTTEASYTVKKGRKNAGTANVDDQTIDAATSADALSQAMKGDPNAGDYEKIEVSKDKASSRVRTKPQTVSQVAPATEPRTGFESVNYPYNLGLPMGFSPLFESLTKKLKESLVIRTRYGKLHIQVPDAEVMEGFMSEIGKRARGKTEVKEMANVVVNGINESVNK